MTKKTIINLFASALLITIGGSSMYYFMTNTPKAQTQKPSISGVLVETAMLKPSRHDVIITSIGSVEAAQKVSLSSKVSGKIIHTSASFVPGALIKEGEVLAQIDPVDYQVAIEQLQAQLRSAKATEMIELGQQESAKKELELSGLTPTGLSRSLILREPQLSQVRASIESLEASLKTAQNNLKETTIKAPFAGMITKKSAELGGYISAQSTLAELVATKHFWLYASIPHSQLSLLSGLSNEALSNLSITLSNTKGPLHVKTTLLKLLPELDATTKQAKVLIAIEDPLGLHESKKTQSLFLGDTLHVSIVVKTIENGIALPAKWLRANKNVWAMDEAGKLRIKPVEILSQNDETVLIQSGISSKDKIITTYLASAVEGMDVVDIAQMKKVKKGDSNATK